MVVSELKGAGLRMKRFKFNIKLVGGGMKKRSLQKERNALIG